MPVLTLPCGHSMECDILPSLGDNKSILINYPFNGTPRHYMLTYNEYGEEYVTAAVAGEDAAPQVIVEQVNEYLKSVIRTPGNKRQFMVTDVKSQSYVDCNLHYIKTEQGIVTDGNIDVYLLDTTVGTVITQVRLEKDKSACKVNPGFREIDIRYLQMLASELGRINVLL